MASRLSSEKIKSRLDGGLYAHNWKTPENGELLMRVDLDRILATNPEVISNLPSQLLFQSIKHRGFDDLAEVLPRTSLDQFQRFIDYDCWLDDRLESIEMAKWFKAYQNPSAAFERFKELDEEYQIASLQGYVKTYDKESFEALSPERQDTLFALPCGEAFYEITTHEKELIEFIQSLINTSLGMDVAYAYSLLAHVDYMPPNESEEQLRQFRNARISEDGFIPFEESVELFRPLNQKIEHTSGLETTKEELFLDRVILSSQDKWGQDETIELQQKLLTMANFACSATRVEPGDIGALNMILAPVKGLFSYGLELLSGKDIDRALELIKSEHPNYLIRTALTCIYDFQDEVINDLQDINDLERAKLKKLKTLQHWGEVQWFIDKDLEMDQNRKEILKALLNRFPMAPTHSRERLEFEPIFCHTQLRTIENRLALQ